MCKLQHNTNSKGPKVTVTHSVTVNEELSWSVQIHGKPVHKTNCTPLKSFPETIQTKVAVNGLLQRLKSRLRETTEHCRIHVWTELEDDLTKITEEKTDEIRQKYSLDSVHHSMSGHLAVYIIPLKGLIVPCTSCSPCTPHSSSS